MGRGEAGVLYLPQSFLVFEGGVGAVYSRRQSYSNTPTNPDGCDVSARELCCALERGGVCGVGGWVFHVIGMFRACVLIITVAVLAFLYFFFRWWSICLRQRLFGRKL